MKKILSIAVLGSFLMMSAYADEGGSSDRKDRKGFFLGFGVGGGGELKEIKRFGAAVPFKIGVGLNNHLMLHYTAYSFVTNRTNVDYYLGDALASVTFFFNGESESSFFLTGGLGIAWHYESYPVSTLIDSVFKAGFGGHFGWGYEWRIGRAFAIQAQQDFIINKVKSRPSMIIVGATGNFLWYF